MSRFLFASALVLGLSACATLTPSTPEDTVTKRSTQRMAALQKSDFQRAYEFMSPGYRATNSVRFFEADHVGLSMVKAFEVVDARCEEERCRVGLNVRFNLEDIGGMAGMRPTEGPRGETEMYFQENWVLINGKWWVSKK